MLNPQDYFDKLLLSLRRELRTLTRQRWISVSLSEPIQRGWKRFHVLSEKGEDRADKAVMLELLKYLGTTYYKKVPDFRERRGRGKRRRYLEVPQPLRDMSLREWQRLGLPEAWKVHFRHVRWSWGNVWHDMFIFRNPSIFTLKIEPHWLTHSYILDSAIEQRIAYIKAWLRDRNAEPRLDWIRGKSRYWTGNGKTGRQQMRDKVARRELWEAMNAVPEVDFRMPERRAKISLRRPRPRPRLPLSIFFKREAESFGSLSVRRPPTHRRRRSRNRSGRAIARRAATFEHSQQLFRLPGMLPRDSPQPGLPVPRAHLSSLSHSLCHIYEIILSNSDRV